MSAENSNAPKSTSNNSNSDVQEEMAAAKESSTTLSSKAVTAGKDKSNSAGHSVNKVSHSTITFKQNVIGSSFTIVLIIL